MSAREKEVKIIRPTKEGDDAGYIRVGAYCRVSTDSEDQLNSFFAQVKYYNDYIRRNEKMRLVDIYADEGITGTEMQKRDEFKRMLKDAKNRKLDRILVKSVTRFARNSLECIEAVRELKACGVSVFFENDNLDTEQMNSEIILYIKSAFAQQEALSASRRMAMSVRMRMENGTYKPSAAPYGYKLEDGDLVVLPDEAEQVRKVYELYLSGMGEKAIVKYMQTHETGGLRWSMKQVSYLLTNERYVGDLLMRKYYTPPMLPLRAKKNRGEEDMFLCEGAHETIVPKEDYLAVQEMRRERSEKYFKPPQEKQFFQGKIVCEQCGWRYRKHQKDREWYWKCGKKGLTSEVCHAPLLSDKEIRRAFVRMFNTLKQNEKTVIGDTIQQLQTLKIKVNGGNGMIAEIDNEMATLSKQNSTFSDLFLKGVIDSVLYFEKTDRLKNRMAELRERRQKLVNEDEEEKCLEKLRALKRIVEKKPFLTAMDEALFDEIVDKIRVGQDGSLTFALKCELKLRVKR